MNGMDDKNRVSFVEVLATSTDTQTTIVAKDWKGRVWRWRGFTSQTGMPDGIPERRRAECIALQKAGEGGMWEQLVPPIDPDEAKP